MIRHRYVEVCRACLDAYGSSLRVRGPITTRRDCEICGHPTRATFAAELEMT
jgi:rRNA maturation endonuclease Nob1